MKFPSLSLKNRGAASVKAIVGVAVALIMTLILMPIALNEIGGINIENWGSDGAVLLVIIGTVLPLLAVLGLALKFIDF